MENHNQNLDTQVKKEKKKQGRKKVESQANSPSSQKEKDAFEKKKLTHYLKKEIRLDNAYYRENRQELEDILTELNDTLGNAAIAIYADADTVLKININLDKFRNVTQRKAGRKKKRSGITIDEINEYRKTHTSKETFEWLGLTKQTYYRKLREHKKENHEGTVEF